MILSLILWIRHKTLLYQALFFVWATGVFTFLIQGFLTQNTFLIILGFSVNFLSNLPIAFLIASPTGIEIPWRRIFFFMLACYVISFIFYINEFSFTIIALPIAIGVAYPILHAAIKALTTKWNQLTFSARAFCFTCLFIVLHLLDYPFLRPIEATALPGFTIAILAVFALSVFATSFILEINTKNQAKISAELDVARKIQMDILPNNPMLPGFDLACYMRPAEEVGGDYYDVFTFGNLSWLFVGDVTGHGLGSGLVMFMVQSIISSILHTKEDISPSKLNKIANNILFNNLERLNEKRPMTLVSMCINNAGQFSLSGSHSNIFIYRTKTQEIESISVNHFPLGIGFSEHLPITQDEDSFKLDKDDLLFIGTDGITEAAFKGDYQKGMFDEERLVSFLKNNATLPINEIKEKLILTLNQFTDGNFYDDITFIIAKAT
jgi:serine phosphatase RsbU (regulator of sigma subunit)